MTAAVFVLDFTDPPPAGWNECDCCGCWHVELRLIDQDGWGPDVHICRECFGTPDECDFTDLPLIQKAISHA